jgi:hypothetical protein
MVPMLHLKGELNLILINRPYSLLPFAQSWLNVVSYLCTLQSSALVHNLGRLLFFRNKVDIVKVEQQTFQSK